ESLLAARRAIALAALPVIAGLALQSSTAGSSTSPGLKPAVTTPAAASLLTPLDGANDRLGIAVAVITGVADTAGTVGLDAPAAQKNALSVTLPIDAACSLT